MNTENVILFDLGLIFLLKALCFVLGYKTIKLGQKLINDGIKGEFKFSLEYTGLKAGLISASPGLLFVLLGVGIIITGIALKKNINYETSTKNIVAPKFVTPGNDSLN